MPLSDPLLLAMAKCPNAKPKHVDPGYKMLHQHANLSVKAGMYVLACGGGLGLG